MARWKVLSHELLKPAAKGQRTTAYEPQTVEADYFTWSSDTYTGAGPARFYVQTGRRQNRKRDRLVAVFQKVAAVTPLSDLSEGDGT